MMRIIEISRPLEQQLAWLLLLQHPLVDCCLRLKKEPRSTVHLLCGGDFYPHVLESSLSIPWFNFVKTLVQLTVPGWVIIEILGCTPMTMHSTERNCTTMCGKCRFSS